MLIRECPFCRGTAELVGWYAVRCNNSACPVQPCTRAYDREIEAVDAWNGPVPEYVAKAREEFREAFRRSLEDC